MQQGVSHRTDIQSQVALRLGAVQDFIDLIQVLDRQAVGGIRDTQLNEYGTGFGVLDGRAAFLGPKGLVFSVDDDVVGFGDGFFGDVVDAKDDGAGVGFGRHGSVGSGYGDLRDYLGANGFGHVVGNFSERLLGEWLVGVGHGFEDASALAHAIGDGVVGVHGQAGGFNQGVMAGQGDAVNGRSHFLSAGNVHQLGFDVENEITLLRFVRGLERQDYYRADTRGLRVIGDGFGDQRIIEAAGTEKQDLKGSAHQFLVHHGGHVV